MSRYTNNLFNPNEKNNAWVHLYDFVPEGSRVLDIGCSSGNFGDVLINEKNCQVIGLDIDEPDIHEAKKKLTAAHVRNIEHDSIADLGKFDVIVFADVLEHLYDPVAALLKVKKVLKKGGRVAFSIPNMAHISIRLQLLEGYFEYTPIGVMDRTHLHYYDEVEVKHIFTESKFKITTINPHTWTYPHSILSDRLRGIGLAIRDKEKFEHTLRSTKANVWQFVGYAEPTATKESTKRPIHYSNPPEELSAALQARDQELQEAQAALSQLEAENHKLKEFYRNPVKNGIKRLGRYAKYHIKAYRDRRKPKA